MMNYLQKKKLAFMSIVNRVKGFIRTITGVFPLTLTNCVDEESITDYTIYGNSVQDGTPTPDTPIEVESVGERTKNLFDIENTLYSTGYLTKTGEINSQSDWRYTDYIKVDGQTVTLSYASGANAPSICAYDENKNFINGINYGGKTTITLTCSGMRYVRFSIQSILITRKAKIQLVLGNTVTDYEPYGYKIPVTVRGKNLFDIDSVNNSTYVSVTDGVLCNKYGMYAQAQQITCNVKTLSAGTYTLSCEVSDSTNSTVYIGFRINGSLMTKMITYKNAPNWIRCSYTFTLQEESTINGIILQEAGNASSYTNLDVLFRNIQLEKADSVTDYEPYHEPITTNIYLDEPLRKVGDYADYIKSVDLVNGTGVVVRNVYKCKLRDIPFNGKSGNATSNSFYASYNYATKTLKHKPNIKLSQSDTRDIIPSVFCEKLPPISWNTMAGNTDIYGICVTEAASTTGNEIRISLPSSQATTPNEANQWVIKNDCDVYLVYLDEYITETPITLPKIPTFKGTSILNAETTIQPSNAEVTYYSTLKG